MAEMPERTQEMMTRTQEMALAQEIARAQETARTLLETARIQETARAPLETARTQRSLCRATLQPTVHDFNGNIINKAIGKLE